MRRSTVQAAVTIEGIAESYAPASATCTATRAVGTAPVHGLKSTGSPFGITGTMARFTPPNLALILAAIARTMSWNRRGSRCAVFSDSTVTHDVIQPVWCWNRLILP